MLNKFKNTIIGIGILAALFNITIIAAGVTRISYGTALPTNCVDGNIFVKTSATTGVYWCSTAGSPGTWSAVGSGTVTTTGSPANGNLTKFSGSTSITNGDLSGDVTTSGTLATTLANSGVSAATYGSSSQVPQIVVDAKGRITSASNVTIAAGVVCNAANGSTNDSLSSLTYTTVAGDNPAVTMTTGTSVTLWMSSMITKGSTGNTSYLSVAVSGSTTIAAADGNGTLYAMAIAGGWGELFRVVNITGLTAGSNTFTLNYKVDGGTWTLGNRGIAVCA